MAMTEAMKKAAAKRFKTAEFDLGDGQKIHFRELSRPERKALDARLFETDEQGQVKADADGNVKLRADARYAEEWLAATNTDGLTVEDFSDDAVWFESVKRAMLTEAQRVNGFTIEDAAKNS